MNINRFLTQAAALTVFALTLVCGANAQTAAAPVPAEYTWGAFHPGAGQHVLLNFSLADPTSGNPVTAITLNFSIKDANGAELGRFSQTLLPGRAVTLDSRAIIAVLHGAVQPVVRVTVDPGVLNSIIGVLEVVDEATGRVQFALNTPRVLVQTQTPTGAFPPGPTKQ